MTDPDEIYRQRTARFYDQFSLGVDGDVEFYVEEAVKSGGPVLEIGSGTGRTLFPMASAGVEVVGLEPAEPMLQIAHRKLRLLPEAVQSKVEMVHGDVRTFSLGRRFPLITMPFRAFLHLLTVEDQKAALKGILSHLSDDGLFIFNIFDPSHEYMADQDGELEVEAEAFEPSTGQKTHMWCSSRYDHSNQLLFQNRVFETLDEDGDSVESVSATLALRYATRYEVQHLLELGGFEVVELYGGFKRKPHRYPMEQVWVARRREQQTERTHG